MSICSHQYFHSIVRAFLSGANLLTWSIFLRSWSLRRQLRLQFCQSLAAGVKISHTSKNNHRTYFRWWFVCSPVLLFRKQMLAKMWQKKNIKITQEFKDPSFEAHINLGAETQIAVPALRKMDSGGLCWYTSIKIGGKLVLVLVRDCFLEIVGLVVWRRWDPVPQIIRNPPLIPVEVDQTTWHLHSLFIPEKKIPLQTADVGAIWLTNRDLQTRHKVTRDKPQTSTYPSPRIRPPNKSSRSGLLAAWHLTNLIGESCIDVLWIKTRGPKKKEGICQSWE